MEQLIPNLPQTAVLAVWFIIVYRLVRAWLFDPYLQVLDERFADTEGAAEGFAELREKIENAEATRRARLDAARATGQQRRDEVLEAARSEAAAIVEQAQDEARAALDKALAEIAQQKQQAEAAVGAEIDALADQATAQLLKGAA
ncbi:MAG: hypothetical protein D6761_00550 [Candidatus Dadabacteria bacterium]|nr:MAG: hypothetical protein D6761_00550 [Candidatus Dadabacteria bacterium]